MSHHGSRACYNGGCREPDCVKANRDYMREYNGRKPLQPTINDLALTLLQVVREYHDLEFEMERHRWMHVSRFAASRVENAALAVERALDGKTYVEIGLEHGIATTSARCRAIAGAPVVYLCALAVKEGLGR